MGGNGGHGGGYDRDIDDEDENHGNGRQNKGGYNREFTSVSPNKVVVPYFSGTNLINKPYLPFNKVVRKLIKAQGPSGALLLSILDDVEKYGVELYDNDRLQALMLQCPKAQEYNIAIQTVLDN